MSTYQNQLIAQYTFEDTVQIGRDSSGKGHDAIAKGEILPVVSEVRGRSAVTFNGERMELLICNYLQICFGM